MAIINFGSINIDHVYQVEHFVKPGETLASSQYKQLLGGKGANQSIALALAGADVKHVGAINESDATFKQTLIRKGVDCQYVKCTDTPSGHAIIQVTPTGENAIVLFGGANLTLTDETVNKALSNTSSADWVLTQNETSSIADILSLAHSKQLKVAFNPAPMSDSVNALPLDCVDLLIVNETEAQAITGQSTTESIVTWFTQNWKHGEVILTLGKEGVIMVRKDGTTIDVPAFSVEAVDTTAAGDCFIGYFLSAYSHHTDARQALIRGCAASAIAVTREGAAQSIPTQNEVDRFLAKHGK
ncbi:ribokinase [Alteromonas sp. C1M14]|uniref:ribokinase n=1 Tax=Alteromonas sp. C1M14 TaxID=2841567 RepID=UPI001C0A114A|nr:ribokinase [Alteromonas sp. C1M14]MBU2979376.1 ribokinase [Alteromonas sp. C1M14]